MANRVISNILTIAIAIFSGVLPTYAQDTVKWEASTIVNVGTGDFAPYYIMSNEGGVITQPITLMERGVIYKNIQTEKRFDYGFGADIIANWSKSTDYQQYNKSLNSFQNNPQHPARLWVQQLWGEVKYRSLFAIVGMKEMQRSIFNSQLGSGDIVESNNARPIPQIRAGFIDFQDIPFTNGWVQIQGEIAYGKNMDSNWLKNHYNYYNSFLTTDQIYHYKRCYFRTNPEQPLSVTVGMQHAVQICGEYSTYKDGVITGQTNNPPSLDDFIDAFLQFGSSLGGKTLGDQVYWAGNHLGSWDLKVRYRLKNGSHIIAYMQSPYEDGSGIGKLNGWDGVWGIEYKSSKSGIINGAVVEYIDFTNQSGPIHYSPSDHPGTQISGQATGADDYYNNYMYNGWTNYGMSIGSPFLPATIYNVDGYMRYKNTRIRGFHIGISGNINYPLSYRLLFSHRTAWGTPFIPSTQRQHNTSMMIEGIYTFPDIPHLQIKGQIAFDKGRLLGDNFGALVSLTYNGNISY